MKYLRIEDGLVLEIIHDFVDIFPNIPARERYTEEFLNSCMLVEDDVLVKCNDFYEDRNFIDYRERIENINKTTNEETTI